MKEFKKLIDALGGKAQMVANIKLESMIDDVDLLTFALCTSNLTVVSQTLSFSNEGETGYIAAHKALDVGWNPTIRETLATNGYFTEGFRGLLKLAERNPIVGSRLMPVFEEAVSIYKELGLPKKLRSELKNYINKKLETDGFAIGNINEDGKTPVNVARWVEAKLDKISPRK